MELGEITPQVRDFIRQHIRSVEQLEILLFMIENPSRAWSAAEVSGRLYIHPDSAAERLADLNKTGLLEQFQKDEKESFYKYKPVTEALRLTASNLAAAYHIRRAAVISMIYETPNANLKTFADAFRIRPDKKEN